MNVHLDCPGCGRLLRVNQQFAGRTLRCPRCGTAYVAPPPGSSPPPDRDNPAPEFYGPASAAASDAIIAADDRPTAVEVAVQADDPPAEPPPLPSPEPRRPPADGPPCPECGEPMAGEAVVCLVCGYNQITGKRLKTVSRRLSGRWDSGNFPLTARLVVFVLIVGACGLPLISVMKDPEQETTWLLLPGAAALIGALALGSFHRVTVTSDSQGTPVLVEQLWVGFVPTPPQTIDLTGFRTIRLTHRAGSVSGLGLLLIFLTCLAGGVLGVVLRTHLFRADVFQLEIVPRLTRDGEPLMEPLTIYRGRSEGMARGIGDALEQIAGLRYG